MPERADQPNAKKLASIYQETLRFKIKQIERIQSRPPFDDHLHAASKKACALLFGAIARSGTFPKIGTPDADRLLHDPGFSSAEQEVLKEILQVHAPDRGTVALEAAASAPYWSAVCAPNLRQNERILLQDTDFKAISARKTTRDAIRLRSLQTIAIMWP
jgi:hypothetical protein